MKTNRKCVVCGGEFLATRCDTKYCSGKCRSAASNKKAAIKNGAHLCKKCGNPKEDERVSGKIRLCGRCQEAETEAKKLMPIKKACEWCGKAFETIRYQQKYCSAECAKEMYKARAYKTEKVCVCGFCEKEFKTMRVKTYCSNECRYAANGQKKEVNKDKGKTKPKVSLAELNARARAEVLSYGQYMAKYGLY